MKTTHIFRKIVLIFTAVIALSLLLISCGATEGGESTASEMSEVASGTASETDVSAEPGEEPEFAFVSANGSGVYIPIAYSNPSALPEGEGAVLLEAGTSSSFAFPESSYAVAMSRRTDGTYEVTETGTAKGSQRDFTVLFRSEADTRVAREYFKKGSGVIMKNTDKVCRYETLPTFVAGDIAFTVTAHNTARADGVSVYDSALPPEETERLAGEDGDIICAVVIRGRIVRLCEGYVPAVPYPVGSLYIFEGAELEKAKSLVVGDKVSELLYETETFPNSYVTVGGRRYAVDARNTERTGLNMLTLYDGDFWADDTRTNIWGLEIAVDADGFVVEVNPAALDSSGSTEIPDGGFVLSVNMENPDYTRLSRVKVGEQASRVTDYMPVYGYRPVEAGTEAPEGAVIIGNMLSGMDCIVYYPEYYYNIYREKWLLSQSRLGEYGVHMSAEKLESAESTGAKCGVFDSATFDETSVTYGTFTSACEAAEEMLYLSVPSVSPAKSAAWITSEIFTKTEVEKMCRAAVKLNLTTVIIDAFSGIYAAYDSDVPGVITHPDCRGFDIIQTYSEYCRKYNLELYVMVCCFQAGVSLENLPDDIYVNRFKDKLLLSKQGRNVSYFYDAPSYTLDPDDADVRAWQLSVIDEICTKYDIDGIQLDYIRYPLPTTFSPENYEDMGYNASSLEGFEAKYGYGVNPAELDITDPRWDDWCEYRRGVITSFVKEASELVRSHGLRVSATCFADNTDRQKYVFQDVAAWLNGELIDELYPMIYAKTYADQKKYYDEISDVLGGKYADKLIMGIGTYVGASEDDLIRQTLTAAESYGGVSVFTLKYIMTCGYADFYFKGLYSD